MWSHSLLSFKFISFDHLLDFSTLKLVTVAPSLPLSAISLLLFHARVRGDPTHLQSIGEDLHHTISETRHCLVTTSLAHTYNPGVAVPSPEVVIGGGIKGVGRKFQQSS